MPRRFSLPRIVKRLKQRRVERRNAYLKSVIPQSELKQFSDLYAAQQTSKISRESARQIATIILRNTLRARAHRIDRNDFEQILNVIKKVRERARRVESHKKDPTQDPERTTILAEMPFSFRNQQVAIRLLANFEAMEDAIIQKATVEIGI